MGVHLAERQRPDLQVRPNTEKNEHCNLFGFYYPTEDPTEAIDCVHKEDGSNLRIVAQ